MEYYVFNPGGPDRGPFTLEELQAKLRSGALDSKTQIRLGIYKDYRPLSQIVDSRSPEPVPSLDPDVSGSIRPFRRSELSDLFIAFAVVDFIAAAIGLLMAFSEVSTGVTLFAVGLSGGFLCLALAKILHYLGEAVFRLRNLEEYATRKP